MSDREYFAREAAVSLLKMAKTSTDPNVAAGLVQRAADLKDWVDQPPELGSEEPAPGSAETD